VAATCKETVVIAVHLRQHADYIIDTADGHSYRRDPQGAETFMGGRIVKFSVGDKAYVCTNISGDSSDELDVVDSPRVLDYSGHYPFHRIR
jgi:hypothetical protein